MMASISSAVTAWWLHRFAFSSATARSRPRGVLTHPFAWSALALVGMMFAALGTAEALGWPFLRGPLERALANQLGAEVAVTAPFAIRLLRPPRLEVQALRIGVPGAARAIGQKAPSEAIAGSINAAPFLLEARDVALDWRWSDLWSFRQGEVLRVKSLQARRLDAHLLRDADGSATWIFPAVSRGRDDTVPKQHRPLPETLPRFEKLVVEDGRVQVFDAPVDLALDIRFRVQDRQQSRADQTRLLLTGGWASGHVDIESAWQETDLLNDLCHDSFNPMSTGALRHALLVVNPPPGFELKADGRYRGEPVHAELRAAQLLPFVSSDLPGEPSADAKAQPVAVVAKVQAGRVRLDFDGTAADLLGSRQVDGTLVLKGPSLSAVGSPLGLSLPRTLPFSLRGRLLRSDSLWHLDVANAVVGQSQLSGRFSYDTQPEVHRLSGQLRGRRLALPDLGPSIGADGEAARASASPHTVIPRREFNLPALQAMDVDIDVALDEFDLGTSALEPLRPLKAHIRLARGVLKLEDIDARTAGGRISGTTQLDGSVSPPAWRAELSLRDVDLAGWVRAARTDGAKVSARSSGAALRREREAAHRDAAPVRSLITGQLQGQLQLTGQGRSTAEILASLDGQVRAVVQEGSVSHLAVELAGLDVAQALGVALRGDDTLPLICAVSTFDAKQGVLTPRVAVFDTRDSTVAFDGRIDLRDESLDLRGTVKPKDFTLFSLRAPLRVQGRFNAPSVRFEPVPIAGRLAAGAALAAINPLAALIAFIDAGGEATPGCKQLVLATVSDGARSARSAATTGDRRR